ncbi:methionine ABC transporter ATP-binding protein [Ornithinimicrobium sp. Arc0846-15]|nr:methionine ABC transporter ATP-binding protein [Ornithinimicrobium laminariae]
MALVNPNEAVADSQPLVSLRGVTKRFAAQRRKSTGVLAVDDVSLDVAAGDVCGVIGYSGAGKSTLVRLINALEPINEGQILVDGQDIASLSGKQLRVARRNIGMIFQQFNLFASRTVLGNVAFPLRQSGMSGANARGRAQEMLDFVGLADKASNYPEQLSGGQKQRVGIARALAPNPTLLLADEATSALDPETTSEVLGLLRRANTDLGITMVLITHEMEVIQSLATHVAVMEAGRVVEHGEVFDVFARPRHPASRKFVGTVVKGVPSPAEAAMLRERHTGKLVTVSFTDGAASQGEVFQKLGAAGVPFELVYGGINEVQGKTFGHLTLALQGSDVAVDGALSTVREVAEVTEVA